MKKSKTGKKEKTSNIDILSELPLFYEKLRNFQLSKELPFFPKGSKRPKRLTKYQALKIY